MDREPGFRPYSVASRARPCRLAFLVDPDDCPPQLLDTLFKSNYEIWGGRYNPIIPVRRGGIADQYWALLRYVDPDVIYAHVQLPERLVKRLDDEIAPLRFEAHHKQLKEKPPYFPPSYAPMLVRSERVLHQMLSGRPLAGHKPKLLTYAAGSEWPELQLAARNFGVLHDPWLSVLPEGTEKLTIQATWDRTELFNQLASHGDVVFFPFQAAEARSGFWQPAIPSDLHYCILIGEGVETWLHFWNRIFVVPHYIRSSWNTLCLPKDVLTAGPLDNALRDFIKKFTHRSSNHSPEIGIQSFECEEAELESFARRVLKNLDVSPKVKKLTIDEFVAPASRSYPSLTSEASNATHQQANNQDALLSPPAAAIPLNVGTWMMDLWIQYTPRFPFYVNEFMTWRLPRRQKVGDAFVPGHPSRTQQTCSVSSEMRNFGPFRLRRPAEAEIFNLIVEVARTTTYTEDLKVDGSTLCFEKFVESDKALYVNGIIELFGGLQQAGHFFQHSFWRNVLAELSNRGSEAEKKTLEPVQNKIRKHKGTILTQLANGSEKPVEWLSRLVVQLGRQQGSSEPDVAFTHLKERFLFQREQYIAEDPSFRMETTEEGIKADQKSAIEDLRRTLQGLVNCRILLQGIRVSCDNCGSGYWREMGTIRQESVCEGCGATIHAPVEPTWRYRLNSLVRNGIALYGSLAVIIALRDLRERAKEAFAYVPGVVLYRKWEDEEPEAEIDLLCISDGQLVCGEVKSDASEFTTEELNKLIGVARELRADRVVIFAFRDPKKRMEELRRSLTTMIQPGCDVDAWSANPFSFELNPHP